MFTSKGISFILLLVCCLYTLFALNVSGQDKQPEQNSHIESPPETFNVEPEIEKIFVEKLINISDDSQNISNQERNFFKGEIEGDKNKNESSNIKQHKKISKFNYDFCSNEELNMQIDFSDPKVDGKQFSFPLSPADSFNKLKNSPSTDDFIPTKREGFRWGPAIRQSMIFLAVQHGYALTQPKTRESLRGNFFKDYAISVKALNGWDDGGRFFTNYIAHPMQGSMTGFIYVQNDPKAINQQFGKSGDYWRSRMKAMAWSAAWSTQFEIGLLSQASIGNIGMQGKQTWEDIVVTPTLGTAMLITEDAVDRYIMQSIERKTDNLYIKIFFRMLLSPTRVFANMLRYKTPWHRDRSYGY